jgi:Helicase HerA, central domain
VQVAPLATNFHYELNSDMESAAPLALPAPTPVVKPMAEWMAWVDDQPHTLLGGRTRAGKTWLATVLLERRIDNGADVFIIDPHSSDWMGLPTAGGSGTDERKAALKAVLNEYLRRMAQREEHKRRTGHELPHDYFDPLTVLIDEANALLEELAAEWKTVLKQVASGKGRWGSPFSY